MKTSFIHPSGPLLAVLLIVGCGKRPGPSAPAPVAPPPVAPTTAKPAAPNPAPPAPPPPTSESTAPVSRPEPFVASQVEVDLQKLLVRYYNDNQRPAMGWEDLLGRYIPVIPRGPDGKPLDWSNTMQRIGKASDRSRK